MKSLWKKLFPSHGCGCHGGEKTLRDVVNGQTATIKCLKGDDADNHRLREMGFRESAVVEKMADNGALICKVGDTKAVISKKLAENIVVKCLCHKEALVAGPGMVLLSQMTVGQKGVIRDFACESDDCERVEEMGITPGEKVEIVRYAPLGDPIEIRIRGYLLSLRKEEADLIQVKLTE